MMRKIFIILMTLVLLGCSDTGGVSNEEIVKKDKLDSEQHPNDLEYIKAAHYFGNEWPINFWSSELHDVDVDFQQIKNDGFNTVVLVIPWGEFQPKITPIKYNETLFDRLKTLIEEANKEELRVILRLGYAWDFDPEVELPNVERLKALHTDNVVYEAWLSYIEKINNEVKAYPNVLFGFLTWEDFWSIVDEASHINNLEDRLDLAKKVNFTDFLKEEYTLKQISKIYNSNFKSWSDVPTPLRDKEEFSLFYKFMDYLLIDKFYKPAKERFPLLSMEVRVDSDPINRNNKDVEWFSHKETFDLPNFDYTTIYYSPAMGALNIGDYVSAEESIERQERLFANIFKESNKKRIFIDQFLYMDNTPAFSKNTQVLIDEIEDFIKGSTENMKKYTSGYGVWVYKDYAANLLYNPQFEFDLKGWDLLKGKVEIIDIKGDKFALLKEGNILTQKLNADRDFYNNYAEKMHLWFEAKGIKNESKLKIKIGEKEFVKNIGSNKETIKIEIPIEEIKGYDLSFEVLNGSIALDDIKFYSFIQKAELYNLEKEEGKLINSIRELNNSLSRVPESKELSEFDANNTNSKFIKNSTEIFKDSYPIEGEEGEKYVWVSKNSKLNLNTEKNVNEIEIKGYIPFALHKNVNNNLLKIGISIYVNGKQIYTENYTKDAQLDISLKLDELTIPNDNYEINIVVDNEVNPKKNGIGLDERDLSIIINKIILK